MRKYAAILVSVLTLWLFFGMHEEVYAASFPAEYFVTYTINDDGVTLVEESITITNETTDQYPSQYTLALENVRIDSIAANDAQGDMRIEIEKRGEFLLVTAFFNVQAHGQGTELPWSLRYTAADVAKKVGHKWEVTLPYVQRDERITNYTSVVKVPNSFGTLDYSDPYPSSYERLEAEKVFTYTFPSEKQVIGAELSFGSFQLTDIALDYHLHNTGALPATTEIALPPSIAPYQTVFIHSVTPEPRSFRTDNDGNMFAQYRLEIGERLDVRFEGQIRSEQVTLDEETLVSNIHDVSMYLQEDAYWDVHHAEIADLAEEVTTGIDDDAVLDKARAVYDYVVDTLTYDATRLEDGVIQERRGSLTAIAEPNNSICTDYTDLTIALMRQIGIPAREVNGYAFTGNEDLPTINDVLHAWVQIYIPEIGWINIDPTWGSTSGQNYFDRFDTRHLIFSIRGESSEYPYPAGSYKINGEETSDVHVAITDTFTDGELFGSWLHDWQEEHDPVDLIDWIFRRFFN